MRAIDATLWRRGYRKQFYRSLKIAWHSMEPLGVARALMLQQRVKLLGRFDPLSVEGQARRLGIPVHCIEDANAATFHALLRRVAPDVVLNQSELLLKEPVLQIPRLGFINPTPRCCRASAAGWGASGPTPLNRRATG